MSVVKITTLLENKLFSVAKSLGLKVASENIQFDPPSGIYLQSFILPAETLGLGLAGKMEVLKGVFQVNVSAPAGSGKTKPGAIVDAIIEAFPSNLELSDGEFSVYINSTPSQFPPIPDNVRYLIPISMSYRADTIKN